MITFTTFNNLQDSKPVLHQEEWSVFCERFADPKCVDHKNGVHTYYSFAQYYEGSGRGNDGIQKHHGLILDFDIKEDLTGDLKGPDFIRDVLEQHNLDQYTHVWHTTYSYTLNQPRFRVFLPMDKHLQQSMYKDAFDRVQYLLKDSPYLDACGSTPSQIYAGPCLHKEKPTDEYYYHGFHDSFCIKPFDLPQRPPKPEPDIVFAKSDPKLSNHQQEGFLQDALQSLDPDMDYQRWINVGMALKGELGDGAGFALWNTWSSRGQKYKGPQSLMTHWKSFKAPIVDGSYIVKAAKEHGFDPKSSFKRHADIGIKPTIIQEDSPIQDISDDEDDEAAGTFFDEHQLFKDWGEFNYNGDIFDLSPYPLLDRLNQTYLLNTIERRHNMRLASVLSVAGHVMRHVYKCPYETPLYIWGLLPTGTGKGAFKYTTLALLQHFNLSQHVAQKIGSIQGFVKFLLNNNGSFYNLVDEIADYYRIMRKQLGDSRRSEIMTLFKDLYGGRCPTGTDLIKKEDIQQIPKTSVSMFWLGPDTVFKYMGIEEFTGGTMNRILVFVENCGGDFGASSVDELLRLGNPSVEIPDFADIKYQFPDQIRFGSEVTDFILAFQEMARKKYRGLCEDARANILTRSAENLLKLSVLTAGANGQIYLDAVRHMAGIMIHCFKNLSYCVNKHFEINAERKDVIDVANRLNQLDKNNKGNYIHVRELCRSMQRKTKKDIDTSLDRLHLEGVIELQRVKRGNKETLRIKVLPSLKKYLTQE